MNIISSNWTISITADDAKYIQQALNCLLQAEKGEYDACKGDSPVIAERISRLRRLRDSLGEITHTRYMGSDR